MKRILLALLAGGTMAGAVAGAAATLDVDGGVLQSGVDATLTCSNRVSVRNYAVEGDGVVYNARLAGLEGCIGQKVIIEFNGNENLQSVVTLTDGAPTAIALGTDGPGDVDANNLFRVTFPAGTHADSIGDLRVTIHTGSN